MVIWGGVFVGLVEGSGGGVERVMTWACVRLSAPLVMVPACACVCTHKRLHT